MLDALDDAKPTAKSNRSTSSTSTAGPNCRSGKKSVAILVLMRDTERTLTDADSERDRG